MRSTGGNNSLQWKRRIMLRPRTPEIIFLASEYRPPDPFQGDGAFSCRRNALKMTRQAFLIVLMAEKTLPACRKTLVFVVAVFRCKG